MPTSSPPVPTLSRRAARAQLLMDVLTSGRDLTALDGLLEQARNTIRSEWSHFSLLTDRQLTAASCGPSWAPVHRGAEIPFDDTICATVLRSGETLAICDTQRDARVSSIPVVQAGGIGSYLGVPVHVDGLLVGVLCVIDAHPREWTDQDVATLQTMAESLRDELLRLSPSEG